METVPIFMIVAFTLFALYFCYKVTSLTIDLMLKKTLQTEKYSVTMKFEENDKKWGFVIIETSTGKIAYSITDKQTWYTFFTDKDEALRRCKMYNEYGVM